LSAGSDVVDELEEGEVERQRLLGDAAVGAEPTPQERPEAFQRVDVDLAEAVAVLVAGVFALPMADRLMSISPFFQPVVDVVFVGVDERPRGDRRFDQRADRRLLAVLQHPDHDPAAALEHAEDRRLLLLERPSARSPLQASAAAEPPFFWTASGWPLCPATT